MRLDLATLRMFPYKGRPRECEVQPHGACPDGCRERAVYEVRFLDGQSFLCATHAKAVKAELDRGAPCQVKSDPGTGEN